MKDDVGWICVCILSVLVLVCMISIDSKRYFLSKSHAPVPKGSFASRVRKGQEKVKKFLDKDIVEALREKEITNDTIQTHLVKDTAQRGEVAVAKYLRASTVMFDHVEQDDLFGAERKIAAPPKLVENAHTQQQNQQQQQQRKDPQGFFCLNSVWCKKTGEWVPDPKRAHIDYSVIVCLSPPENDPITIKVKSMTNFGRVFNKTRTERTIKMRCGDMIVTNASQDHLFRLMDDHSFSVQENFETHHHCCNNNKNKNFLIIHYRSTPFEYENSWEAVNHRKRCQKLEKQWFASF